MIGVVSSASVLTAWFVGEDAYQGTVSDHGARTAACAPARISKFPIGMNIQAPGIRNQNSPKFSGILEIINSMPFLKFYLYAFR